MQTRTLPRGIAANLAAHLPLRVVESPVRIPPLRVAMYWHERVQRDARNRWLRSIVARGFEVMAGSAAARSRQAAARS